MTEQEALELGKKLYANIINNENNIIKTNDYIEFAGMTIKALEEVQQYHAIGTPEECLEAVDKINHYQNLLGKKVWWIDGLGNRVESTINCFYIEQGIEGVRCELLNCTADADEIGKSIHVIN